jgi:hypothetical protein
LHAVIEVLFLHSANYKDVWIHSVAAAVVVVVVVVVKIVRGPIVDVNVS